MVFFIANDFKGRLRAARQDWGTLKAFAREVGTTYNTLQTWETNPPEKPDASLLAKISSVLGVSVDYLLTGVNVNLDSSEVDAVSSSDPKKQREEAAVKDALIASLQDNVQHLKEKVAQLEEELKPYREKEREASGS